MIRRGWTICVTLIIGACTSHQNESYLYYLKKKSVAESSTEEVQHCHAYGCRKITRVALTKTDWEQITDYFSPAPVNAEEERQALSLTIGAIEQIIGQKAGTDSDIYGTFRKLGDDQLDCVDESTNTTTYLHLLKQKDLLRFHSISSPETRLPLIHSGRWPHQTAVIIEKENAHHYAVDSWFRDNGVPADIVPLKKWKDGWNPHKEG